MYVPSAEERYVFDSLWTILNNQGLHSISGQQVVEFLKTSGLDLITLKSIWDISSSTASLDVNQFYSVLRLISLAQHGVKPTKDKLLDKTHVQPPKFAGIAIGGKDIYCFEVIKLIVLE